MRCFFPTLVSFVYFSFNLLDQTTTELHPLTHSSVNVICVIYVVKSKFICILMDGIGRNQKEWSIVYGMSQIQKYIFSHSHT